VNASTRDQDAPRRQAAPQAAVVVDREQIGVTDAQGQFAKQIRKKAGAEVELSVRAELPGYRVEPWKTTFLVKLPKEGQQNAYRFDADLSAMRYVTLRVSDKARPWPTPRSPRRDEGGRHRRQGRARLPVQAAAAKARARGGQDRLQQPPRRARARTGPGGRDSAQPRGDPRVRAMTDDYGRASGVPGSP